MRVLQILHDRERGGITTLADMIKEGLESHGIVVETDFLFPQPGLDTLTWETFGLAAVEAAMMGLPAVVADLAVLREVLATPGPQAAVFVDPFDVNGWAAAIRAQLQNPPAPDAAAAFARAVARKYSRKRMIDSYLKLLSSGVAIASPRLTQELSA